jgi:glycogen phosphorylase
MSNNVAYFSMEVGLSENIPTYSGGLGVLAGDFLKAASDLELPLVGVTLLYNRGYCEQKIENGEQLESYCHFEPSNVMKELPERVSVKIEDREVKVKAWLYELEGRTGYKLPIYFLDTNGVNKNRPWDEDITSKLYGGNHPYHRLTQEVVLGIGGVKFLQELGHDISTYHMNEGHSSFLTLELLRQLEDINEVKEKSVFTTHTPVKAGHDCFDYNLVNQVMGEYIRNLPKNADVKSLAGEDCLNMTMLAMNSSRHVNAVSKKHAEVTKNMFPGHELDHITNGVHSYTWTSKEFQDLFDKYIPEWRESSANLKKADIIPNEELWNAHSNSKEKLIDYVNSNYGLNLDKDKLTICFARRAAEYKRPDLIFSDLEKLVEIGEDKIQLIFAGKAHPKDDLGKGAIYRINQYADKLKGKIDVVYLENYNMGLGKLLTSGADVWLNNPRRPREACGTSGMKAAHNGVINFSVLDGWFIEAHKEDITGWAIGPEPNENMLCEVDDMEDAKDLYNKLENKIIPLYYNNKNGWTNIMKNSISKIASNFNAERMVNEYFDKLYGVKTPSKILIAN